MKKSIRFFVLFGLCISLFIGCQKDEVHPKPTDFIETKTDLMQSRGKQLNPTIAYEADEKAVLIACSSVTTTINFAGIRWALSGGGVSDEECYDETEYRDALIAGGMSASAADDIIDDIFYSVDDNTAAYNYFTGTDIQTFADGSPLPSNYMQGCYRLRISNPGNYEPAPLPNGAQYSGCAPGTITRVSSGGSYPDFGCTVSGGANPSVQITNTCTGQISTITLSIPAGSGGNVREALAQSGMSQADIAQTITNIALGTLTPREYWNLYQYRIVPYLDELSDLFTYYEELSSCLRFTRVILAMNSGAGHFMQYRVDGESRIYCGPIP